MQHIVCKPIKHNYKLCPRKSIQVYKWLNCMVNVWLKHSWFNWLYVIIIIRQLYVKVLQDKLIVCIVLKERHILYNIFILTPISQFRVKSFKIMTLCIFSSSILCVIFEANSQIMVNYVIMFHDYVFLHSSHLFIFS